MYCEMRNEIEEEIKKSLAEVCGKKGFILKAVLLKSIILPSGLTRSIETKLEVEQEDLCMEFILDRQKMVVERQFSGAEGVKKQM